MATDSEADVATDCRIKGLTELKLPITDLPTLYGLGMPSDQTPRRYVVSAGDEFGAQYKDFLIEFFGTEGTWPEREVVSTRQVTQNWTVYGSQLSQDTLSGGEVLRYHWHDGSVNVVNVWRLRVLFTEHNYTKPYLEQLWIPQKANWLLMMKNIFSAHDPRIISSVKRLADALPLLVLSLGNKTISGYTKQQIEEMIDETIGKMAQAEPDKSRPRRFKVSRFAEKWPIATSRTNIYNYVNKDRLAPNGEIERRYIEYCQALRAEE